MPDRHAPRPAGDLSRTPAVDVCARFRPTRPAAELLADAPASGTFLTRLRERRLSLDGLQFLVHLLPPREAVWWLCLCARQAGGPASPAAELAALRAAVTWVVDPSEANRYRAKAPGEQAGMATPAGAAAYAAFWSGGSMLPPDGPAVPPDPGVTRAVLFDGLLAAGSAWTGLPPLARHLQFLGLGTGIAFGKHVWTAKP